jgi:hypothetical protein
VTLQIGDQFCPPGSIALAQTTLCFQWLR